MTESVRCAYLFKFNKEKIEQCYLKAKLEKVESPVIALFDMSDSGAVLAAVSMYGDGMADEIARRKKDNGADLTLITHLSRDEAERTIGRTSGKQCIADILLSGHIPVAIVSDGGIAWVPLVAPDE